MRVNLEMCTSNGISVSASCEGREGLGSPPVPQGHPAVSAGGGCSLGQLALCPEPQGPGVVGWEVSRGAGASQAQE